MSDFVIYQSSVSADVHDLSADNIIWTGSDPEGLFEAYRKAQMDAPPNVTIFVVSKLLPMSRMIHGLPN